MLTITALCLFKASSVAEPRRQRSLLRRQSDESTADTAVAHQFAQHEARGIRSDGETNPLRAHDHGGVDADNLAAGSDERAARIACIERGVVENHIVDEAAGARPE